MNSVQPTNQDDIKKLTDDVERDLLYHIILNMRNSKLSMKEAQRLAKDFLAELPFSDKEDLLKKLQNLGSKYAEARAVYINYGAPHEEQRRQKLIKQMAEHLKKGDIEKAILIAKGEK